MTVFTHVTCLLSVHAYNGILYIQHLQCLYIIVCISCVYHLTLVPGLVYQYISLSNTNVHVQNVGVSLGKSLMSVGGSC